MKKDSEDNQLATKCVDTIANLLILPTIVFVLGAMGGLFLEVFMGDLVVTGLNFIFGGDSPITKAELPLICGTFALLGRYIKS